MEEQSDDYLVNQCKMTITNKFDLADGSRRWKAQRDGPTGIIKTTSRLAQKCRV